MTVGERIRAARKAKGLTQKQLGEACGIAEPTIRRYELGKLNPKYETLQKIAKPLGLEAQQLLPDNEFGPLFEAEKKLFHPVPPTREEMARALQEWYKIKKGEAQTADFSDVPPVHREKLGQFLNLWDAAIVLNENEREWAWEYMKDQDQRDKAKKDELCSEMLAVVAPLSPAALERVVQVVKLFVENSLGVPLPTQDTEEKDSGEK